VPAPLAWQKDYMKNIHNEKASLKKLNSRMRYTLENIDIKDVKGKTVLDIGCGFGWCELDFINKGVKKAIGIEIADEDLKSARMHIKKSNVIFKVGSGLDIPAKDNSIDTVVCFEVIEHIPKNTEHILFSEINRVLKKGGVFYLSTPYDNPFTKLLDPAWWLIGHRHYSKRKLEELAQSNGFKVKSIAVKGGIWSTFGLLYMYISKWIFRTRTSPLADFFAKKEKHEYKTDNGEGIANIFVTYQLKN